MNKTNKITVIIPVHKLNDTVKQYLKNAITSIETQTTLPQEVLIVGGSDVTTALKDFEFGELKESIRLVTNTGETDFCSQVNFAVEEVKTSHFSVLEYDDEYSKIWFKNVVTYMEHYNDVKIYLPIVLDVNSTDQFLHFTNEPVWAREFSDELGVLDNDSLLNFPNFQMNGSVIEVETFKSVGKLKPSIKLQFGYEFLLRMTYYSHKIMTIPKLGYKKVNMREDSLFYNYYNVEKISPVEARFWFNLSKKEQYFKQDRNIKFENQPF